MFWSAWCFLLKSEYFSCSLDVLYGGLAIYDKKIKCSADSFGQVDYFLKNISPKLLQVRHEIRSVDRDGQYAHTQVRYLFTGTEVCNMFVRFKKVLSQLIFEVDPDPYPASQFVADPGGSGSVPSHSIRCGSRWVRIRTQQLNLLRIQVDPDPYRYIQFIEVPGGAGSVSVPI